MDAWLRVYYWLVTEDQGAISFNSIHLIQMFAVTSDLLVCYKSHFLTTGFTAQCQFHVVEIL